jgi:hypothetical protein
MKRILIFLLAASVAGCETGGEGPPPPPPTYAGPAAQEPFNEEDFAWSTRKGEDAIDGQLVYKVGRYTCQGATVVLAPETPWSRARMRGLYLSVTSSAMPRDEVEARTPAEHSAEYQRYARRTTCDASNRFAFEGLPDGAWYVITLATTASGGPRMAVMRRVVTRPGRTRIALP